ncbi:hypothetical protein [Streptomyces sp. NPDC055681]
MNDVLDFDLDDRSPVDDASEEAMETFWAGDLTVLSQHHTRPNGSHSFVLAHDRSVTWGIPGEPQLVASRSHGICDSPRSRSRRATTPRHR